MIAIWSDVDKLVAQLKDLIIFINDTNYEG